MVQPKNPPPKKSKKLSDDYNDDSSLDYDIDKFEVLKIQNRQLSANQQLENLRNSDMNEGYEEIGSHQKKNDKDWSDDEDFKTLLENIRSLKLQEHFKQEAFD